MRRPLPRLLVLSLGLLSEAAFGPSLAMAQSTINTTDRFAYGANIGWIDWRASSANGAVLGEYICSGYLYAANVGWIHLGNGSPTNAVRYQNTSTNDYGVTHDGAGNLRGFAWGANIGWVNFETLGAPKIDLKTGILSGSAYGANVGWISLSNAFAYVRTDRLAPGRDLDEDGIADAYERAWTGALAAMNEVSDIDGDGVTDRQEFLADTNPINPADYLRITDFMFQDPTDMFWLTWRSRPSRMYKVQQRSLLNPGIPWVDVAPGIICPDAGPSTTLVGTILPAASSYFRVEVLKPLSP